MFDRYRILETLKNWIDEYRLEHSVNVSKCAAQLAGHYGADVEKAELTGLIHDCAKNLPLDKALELGEKYGYEPDMITRMNPILIHAPLGAYLARELFDIDDPEILDAIAWHTTGRKNMTLLEKIICLADFIEEGRSYNGVEDIRKLAFVDINRALLAGFDYPLKHCNKGKFLHPMTIEARNHCFGN